MKVKNYRDLIAWQKSMLLIKEVYEVAKLFPKDEQYALTSQIRRAVVSVASNIAEGSSRKSTQEFIRFLNITYGSLAEVGTQLEIAIMLGYIKDAEETFLLIDEIEKIVSGLILSLDKKVTQLSTLNSNN